MTRVTLHPHIVFNDEKGPSAAEVEAINRKARDACFIANTVKSEVRIVGTAEGLRD